MIDHFCQESVITFYEGNPVTKGLCDRPARFEITGSMGIWGDGCMWLCAEHYDQRIKYATTKIYVD